MKKKLLALSSIGAISSVLPISFAISCGGSGAAKKDNVEKNDYPIYKPFKVDVPPELVPGAKQNPQKYDFLKKKEEELDWHFDRYGNLIVESKNGYWLVDFDKKTLDSDHLQNVDNALEMVKEAIAETNFSPTVSFGQHAFDVYVGDEPSITVTSGDATLSSIVHLKAIHSSMSWEDWSLQTYVHFNAEILTHEFNHAHFHNSLLFDQSLNEYPIIQNIAKEANIPISVDDYKNAKVFPGTNNFSSIPEEWVKINDSNQRSQMELEFGNFNYCNVDWTTLKHEPIEGLSSEFNDAIRQLYADKMLFPLESNQAAQSVSMLSPTYNFMDPTLPRQSYDIMKVWAKNSINLANGNNVWIQFNTQSKDQITNINFSSFGTKSSDQIKSLEVFDKQTNKTIYKKDVTHKQYPFGFNKNPFNDYEYKYVIPGSYLAENLRQIPLKIEPDRIGVRLISKDRVEQPSSVNITSLNWNRPLYKWFKDAWEEQLEKY